MKYLITFEWTANNRRTPDTSGIAKAYVTLDAPPDTEADWVKICTVLSGLVQKDRPDLGGIEVYPVFVLPLVGDSQASFRQGR